MNPTVRIRDAVSSDAHELARVAAVTFPLACPPDAPREQVDAFIASALTESHFAEYVADAGRRVLVVDAGDEIGGYAMVVFGDPADPDAAAVTRRPSMELSKCYVSPDRHGDGTSALLIDAVLDVARQRGLASVWLGVNQQNARANRFYAKHGFEIVGTKHFMLGTRVEDDYVRERLLR